jgi:FAD/FMN-containing dehydrogenase
MSFNSIQQEFHRRIRGDCFFDEETRERFSTAACWYRIKPFGVVAPRSIEDVVATVQICRENEISITARGGATGLAGQAVGSGIILDFTKYMNQISSVDEHSATVQPGIVLNNLSVELQKRNCWFPVDPTSMNLCTLGGMIGTNASGWHGLKYGSTKHHVDSLTAVLADGSVTTFGPPRPSIQPSGLEAKIESLLRPHEIEIRNRFPGTKKNSSGYNLLDATATRPADLRKLVIGSEGTLALVVGATLKTSRMPPSSIGILLYLPTYESTVAATLSGLTCSPAAIEILDRSYFQLRDTSDSSIAELIVPSAQTMLYFEFELGESITAEEILQQFADAISSVPCIESKILESESHRQTFWKLRESVSRKINLEESYGKSSFIEDVAVPVEQMGNYLRDLQIILTRFGIEYSLYGHAGVGNIHCGTFVNLENLAHYRLIDELASEVFALAGSLGGTITGEHGDGYVRTPHLERLYGTTIYQLFKGVKEAFDPGYVFNPGKIIGPQNTSILHDLYFSRGSYET